MYKTNFFIGCRSSINNVYLTNIHIKLKYKGLINKRDIQIKQIKLQNYDHIRFIYSFESNKIFLSVLKINQKIPSS